MFLAQNSEHPIYLQLASAIEDDILSGLFQEDTQIISTTELSITLSINPATANKAINLLVDQELLYKKRGMGMFVTPGAREKILLRRKERFKDDFVLPLLKEAGKINLSADDVIAILTKEGNDDESDRA
mgnify:CR=1 FL=1